MGNFFKEFFVAGGFEAGSFFGAAQHLDAFGEEEESQEGAGAAFGDGGEAQAVVLGNSVDDVGFEVEGGGDFAGGLGVVKIVGGIFEARDEGVEVHRAFEEIKVVG